MKSITDLYGTHPDSDIYVVGTGASMRVFPRNFLNGRISIGVNMAWKMMDVTYGITIHPDLNIPEFMPGEPSIPEIKWVVKKDKMTGMEQRHIAHAETFFYNFRTGRKPGETEPEPSRPGTSSAARVLDYLRRPTEDYLYLWSSVSQTAVNLAANMGARNIILVGCDNADILGNHHSHDQHTRWLGAMPDERYRDYYDGLAEVRTVLRERGVNLVSLNPFLGLGFHEHDFVILCSELDVPVQIAGIDITDTYRAPWQLAAVSSQLSKPGRLDRWKRRVRRLGRSLFPLR